MAMTRLVWAVVAALVLPAVALGVARSYPRYQPSSIAFLDRQHGLLAEEDWSCGKSRGCPAQILVSGDGGTSWRVSYRATMPMRLYPVRGTREVWASTGASVIESRDGGLSWRRVFARPALVSFATPADGWRDAADSTVNHPQPLLATRNGGRSWQTRTNPCRGEFSPLVALSFASPTRGWLVCVTQGGTGFQGKEVWQTNDGGRRWQLRSRVHPIGPPRPGLQLGNLPGFGYPTGVSFLPDGHGWLWEDRGWLLVTNDGGRRWHKSPITKADQVEAQSATLLDAKTGYVLLRGCTVRLVRTSDGARTWSLVRRWNSPTTC
jgi:photosystem II stability/assembly factor-like uncharacterized protein